MPVPDDVSKEATMPGNHERFMSLLVASLDVNKGKKDR